jgi:Chaperone of endosialidase
MAAISADRVRDTTTTTGTGPFAISGAAPVTYRSFGAVMSVGDTCIGFIQQQSSPSEWVVGLLTYSATNQITVTTIFASSNGGAAVNFSAGTKDVMMSQTAEQLWMASGGLISFANDVVLFHTLTGNLTTTALSFFMDPGGVNTDTQLFVTGRIGSAAVTARIAATSGSIVQIGSATNFDVAFLRNAIEQARFSTAFQPASNGFISLGLATVGWSGVFLSSGATINFNNGNYVLTHSAGNLTATGGPFTAPSFIPTSATIPSNGMYLSAANTLAWGIASANAMTLVAASLTAPAFIPTSATVPTNGMYLSAANTLAWAISSANAMTLVAASLTAPAYIPTSATVPSNGMYLPAANTLGWAINSAAKMQLTSAALSPAVSGGTALGTTALQWNGLNLATTTQINWNNGNMTLTHAAGSLAFDGGRVYFFSGNGWVTRSDQTVGTIALDGFTGAPQIITNFQDTGSLQMMLFSTGDVSCRLMFGKSLGAAIGTNTATTANTDLGVIQFCAADGVSTVRRGAEIRVETFGGTTSTTSVPTKMYFVTCAVGSTGPSDGITLDNTGAVRFPRITTTASAANAFVNPADSFNLLQSTSSIRYKKDITAIPQSRIDALKGLRLVEFTSSIPTDDGDVRHVGLIAEEVAAIDPHLVHWGYSPEDYEWPTGKGAMKTSPKLRHGAKRKPDGVQYERVLLLQVAALQKRVADLEAERVP